MIRDTPPQALSPARSDGFIFKCYVNVITNTGKSAESRLCHCYGLSRAMKPFASGGSQVLTSTPNKFSKLPKSVFGWVKHSLISPSLFLYDCVTLYLWDYVPLLTVR